MNDIITKIITTNIEELYNKINSLNQSEKEITKELSKDCGFINQFILFKAIRDSNFTLADELEKSIEEIEQNRLTEFRKAIRDKSVDEYLNKIDLLKDKEELFILLNK